MRAGGLAGVDFPYLAWRQAIGQTVAPVQGRPGVAWMHASHDIVAAYREIRRGTLTPGGYLKSLAKPLAFAAFALDDPMPGLVELPVAAWNRFAHDRFATLQHAVGQKFARKSGVPASKNAK